MPQIILSDARSRSRHPGLLVRELIGLILISLVLAGFVLTTKSEENDPAPVQASINTGSLFDPPTVKPSTVKPVKTAPRP